MGEVHQKVQQEQKQRMARLEEEQNERNRQMKENMEKMKKEQQQMTEKLETENRERMKRLAEQQQERSMKQSEQQRQRYKLLQPHQHHDHEHRPNQYAKGGGVNPYELAVKESQFKEIYDKHRKQIEELKRQNKEQIEKYSRIYGPIKESSKINEKQEIPDYLLCPITYSLMVYPMLITSCGHTFEQKTITEWLTKQSRCPLCSKPAKIDNLVKNFALAQICAKYK